jgi:hypothetical protein
MMVAPAESSDAANGPTPFGAGGARMYRFVRLPKAPGCRATAFRGRATVTEAGSGLGSAVRLHLVPDAPADETVASLIGILQDHLALAREGRLRSLAIVSVSDDGGSIGTQWSGRPDDLAGLIGKLTVLTHDLMAARR